MAHFSTTLELNDESVVEGLFGGGRGTPENCADAALNPQMRLERVPAFPTEISPHYTLFPALLQGHPVSTKQADHRQLTPIHVHLSLILPSANRRPRPFQGAPGAICPPESSRIGSLFRCTFASAGPGQLSPTANCSPPNSQRQAPVHNF